MKRIVIVFVLLLIVDAVVIYLMFFLAGVFDDKQLKTLAYDTIKLSIQLILVVVFGGILIQEYVRIRSRKEAINEFRKTILTNLSRAYSDVKGIRRILRAKCAPMANQSNKENCITLSDYHDYVSTINTTQLNLEIMNRELKIIKAVFSENENLRESIESMEKYLGEIIDEYEKKANKFGNKDPIPLAELPKLNAFIIESDKEESNFLKFSSSYNKALSIIQEERIKVT